MESKAPISHPGEWPVVSLKNICGKIGSGATPKGGQSSYLLERENYAFVRSQNVFDRYFSYDGLAYISDGQADKLKNVELKPGDILLNITGDGVTFARACMVPMHVLPACVNQHVAIIRLDEEVADPGYVLSFLTLPAVKIYIESFNAGGSRRAITKGHIESFQLPLPPIDVQRYIGQVLQSLDDKIELNRQINATLESMAQALFKSWFVDFDPVVDNALAAGNPIPEPLQARAEKRAALLAAASAADTRSASATDNAHPTQTAPHTQPGTTAPATPLQPLPADLRALFPDSFVFNEEMGWVPEGWEVEPIGNLIDRLPVGKKFSQKTASEIGQVPILDQGKSGVIGFHSEAPGVEASPDAPVIVFANHTCYMRLIMHDFSAIQNVLPFKGRELDIYWLYYATLGKQSFIEYKGHWPDFVLHKLVVPNGDLDAAFGERASNFAKAIFARETQNETLSGLRDALLPKLLSGQIELPEVEQLVAEVL